MNAIMAANVTRNAVIFPITNVIVESVTTVLGLEKRNA